MTFEKHRALWALCLINIPLFALAQFGPNIDAPSEVVAGAPTTATVLPVDLYNNDPKFVSSYTLYLTAAATSGRLDFGSGFLQEQCNPPLHRNSFQR